MLFDFLGSCLIPSLRHALLEGLVGANVAHDNDKHLDNLREEALIANLLPLLHYSLNLLPDPLLSGWVCPISLHNLLLAEERLDEFRDQLWLEQLFELSR